MGGKLCSSRLSIAPRHEVRSYTPVGVEMQTRVVHGTQHRAGAPTPTAWKRQPLTMMVQMVGQMNGTAQGVLLYSVELYPAEWQRQAVERTALVSPAREYMAMFES